MDLPLELITVARLTLAFLCEHRRLRVVDLSFLIWTEQLIISRHRAVIQSRTQLHRQLEMMAPPQHRRRRRHRLRGIIIITYITMRQERKKKRVIKKQKRKKK